MFWTLSKLDLSLDSIRAVCEKKCSLKRCLDLQTEILRRRGRDYINMSSFCERMSQAGDSLDTISSDVWLEQIDICEKEGTTFMDVKKTDIRRKKTMGAVGAAVVRMKEIKGGEEDEASKY